MGCKKKEGLTFFLIVLILVIAGIYFSSQEGITGWVVGPIEEAEVENEVFEELEGKEEVAVIVVLEEDSEPIGEKQEKVLNKLHLEEKEGFFGINQEKEFELRHKYSTINAFSGEVTEEGLEKLKRNPEVKKVFFNKVLHITLDSSVPQINADDVWGLSVNGINMTGVGETVCLIDTGIDTDHSAFAGRIVDQYCYCSGGCCPDGNTTDDNAEDDHGHGTHVAGTAAGDYSTYRGVAPGVGIIAIKVCDSGGSCDSDDVISAIDWCVSNASKYNISVISMSLGGDGPYNTYCDDNSYGIAPGINSAAAKNISVVIAAGNSGWTNGISSPSCVENATPVGTVNSADSISYNRGDVLDLLAPGVSITSPYVGGGTTTLSGTSMSTPHVAGAIALFRQYWRLVYSATPTTWQIENKFDLTGKSVADSGNIYSRIDVLKALQPVISFTSDSQANGVLTPNTFAFIDIISDVDLTSALLEWDHNNGTIVNITMDQNDETNFYYNITGLALDNHTYKVYGNDLANNFGISESRILEVGPIPPNVTIHYPEDSGYYKEGFNLNVSIVHGEVLSSSSYSVINSSEEVVQENSNSSIGVSSFSWLDLVDVFVDGNYSLSVLASDSFGVSDGEEINFMVDKTAPVLLGFDKSPAIVYGGDTITFYVNVTDENLDGVLIEGDWTGDFVNYTMELESGDRFSYSVSSSNFSNQEMINYRFHAFDLAGNVDSSSLFNFTVQNSAPSVNITNPLNNAEIELGNVTQFNSLATDADNDNLSYIWDFGDGTNSSEQNPSKQFELTGTWVIVLEVSDGQYSSSTNITVKVNDTLPVEITSISHDSSVHIEDDVNQVVEATFFDHSEISNVALYFNNTIKDSTCTESKTSCSWSWGGFDSYDDYNFIIEVTDSFSNSQNQTYDFSIIGCGDGALNGDEDCEGSNLGGETCVDQGYTGGTLTCSSSCTFDDVNCSSDSGDDTSGSTDDSSGGGSGGGSGGSSSSSVSVCSSGTIQCVGLTQYKECSSGEWSDVVKVPAGQECKEGELLVMEMRATAVETPSESPETSFASPDADLAVAGEEEENVTTGGMPLVGMAVGFIKSVTDWSPTTKVLLALGILSLLLLAFYFVIKMKD